MGRGKTGCADDSYAEVTWLRKASTLSDRARDKLLARERLGELAG